MNEIKDINGKDIKTSSVLQLKDGNKAMTVINVRKEMCIFSTDGISPTPITEELVKDLQLSVLDTIRVKADQELFDEIKGLARSVNTLGAIIQNDMTIETDQLTEWEDMVNANIDGLNKWKVMVKAHLIKK